MGKTDEKLADLAHLMCFNTYTLHHAFGRYYKAGFGDSGFTYAKYIILRSLQDAGPMALGELADRIGLEPNSLSPIVKKMAAFGIIQRVRDPKDERRIVLAIEPYGRDVVAAAEKQMLAGWAKMGIDPDQVAQAISLMQDVRARLDKVSMPKLDVPPRPEEAS